MSPSFATLTALKIAFSLGFTLIVKIPPTASKCLIDKIVDMGYNQIHASNTLYSVNGGRSGKILKPYTTQIIDYIKNKHSHVKIIAGGGVTEKEDAEYYFDKGADYGITVERQSNFKALLIN